MRSLKRLVLLALLVGVAGGAAWLTQSPWRALYEIDRGLNDRDVVRVERFVDLEALVRATAQLVGALAAEQAGVAGSDVGSRILGAVVGAVADRVGDAAAIQGAVELRRAIQDGRVSRALGPFTVHEGWRALGSVQIFDASAVASIKGTCNGNEATLRLMMERKDGTTFGFPRKWVVVGVEKDSVTELARACRAGGPPRAGQ